MSPNISNFRSERKICPLPRMSNPDTKLRDKTKASYALDLDLGSVGKQTKMQNKSINLLASDYNNRRSVSDASSSVKTGASQKAAYRAGAKTNPTTRRVIFSTLYESESQASPLCRNQVRGHALNACIPPNGRATSLGGNDQISLKHPIVHGPDQSMPSKRTKQSDCDFPAVVHVTADVTATSGIAKASSGVLIAQYTSETSNVSIARTHSHDTHSNNSIKSLISNSHDVNGESSGVQSHENMTINPSITLDDPIHESKSHSPTSTANDIHKKILPGPSILRNKSSQFHQKTHLPTMGVMTPDTASTLAKTSSLSGEKITPHAISNTTPPLPDPEIVQPPSSSSPDELEELAKPIKTQAAPNDKWPLPAIQKSMSDSCIDTLSCLSIAESDNSCDTSHTTTVGEASSTFVRSASATYDTEESSRKSSIFITRHISHEEMITPRRKIRFDPRVWVHEIQKPDIGEIWYSPSELEQFKTEAVMRIREWAMKNQRRYSYSSNMIGTGTGRIINTSLIKMHPESRSATKAIYTNPALALEAEDEDETNASDSRMKRCDLAKKEIKKILIVDSHDIFLKLLSKGVKMMMPTAVITTAHTTMEALEKMEAARKEDDNYSHGFDMFIIEERLQRRSRAQGGCDVNFLNFITPSSGSSLIQRISSETRKVSEKIPTKRYPVVVGISAYVKIDEQKLRQSGSDFVWGKPPPKMGEELRDKILMAVLCKRGKTAIGIFNNGT